MHGPRRFKFLSGPPVGPPPWQAAPYNPYKNHGDHAKFLGKMVFQHFVDLFWTRLGSYVISSVRPSVTKVLILPAISFF